MTEKDFNEAIGKIAGHDGRGIQLMQACGAGAALIQKASQLVEHVSESRVSALAEAIAVLRIRTAQLMQLYGIPETEIEMLAEQQLELELERITPV